MNASKLVTGLCVAVLSTSAFAFHCPADMKKIDEALAAGPQLSQQALANGLLQPLLEQSSELAGMLNSDLRFSGDLTNPAINGNLALSGFKLSGKKAPLDVTDANIELKFAGQQATLDGLVSTSKGEINLNGDAQWPQLDNWQAAVKVKGDELSLQIPQARLQIAPDLTLTAKPGLTSLKGTVQIPFARISIDSLPQHPHLQPPRRRHLCGRGAGIGLFRGAGAAFCQP